MGFWSVVKRFLSWVFKRGFPKLGGGVSLLSRWALGNVKWLGLLVFIVAPNWAAFRSLFTGDVGVFLSSVGATLVRLDLLLAQGSSLVLSDGFLSVLWGLVLLFAGFSGLYWWYVLVLFVGRKINRTVSPVFVFLVFLVLFVVLVWGVSGGFPPPGLVEFWGNGLSLGDRVVVWFDLVWPDWRSGVAETAVNESVVNGSVNQSVNLSAG